MRIINLNCQKALNPNLPSFIKETLTSKKHDFILLQEASDKVAKLISDSIGANYKIMRPIHSDGSPSMVCIVHSSDFKIIDSQFSRLQDSYSANMFGVLMGAFVSKHDSVIAVSVHLPAYLKPRKRSLAIKKVKKDLDDFIKKHPKIKQVVLAGDFNSILPWEHRRNKHILAPNMSPVKNYSGYTYHTRRVEPDSLSSAFVHLIGKLGLSFKMTLDHIFVDQVMMNNKTVQANALDINVSDHLPLLIEIK